MKWLLALMILVLLASCKKVTDPVRLTSVPEWRRRQLHTMLPVPITVLPCSLRTPVDR